LRALFSQNYLDEICLGFLLKGSVISCEPHGNGHINDTWKIICDNKGSRQCYILQRINHEIFKDVHALMQNVARVCEHIQGCGLHTGDVPGLKRPLVLCRTKVFTYYLKDTENNYWRMYEFIEGTRSVDILENDIQAYEASKSFGAFQYCLQNLPGDKLNETIPNFHNTLNRLAQFKEVVRLDPVKRVRFIETEINFILKRELLAGRLIELAKLGDIPDRITHNDTKINNVLLDPQSNEGICVIDLDTVMPGLALYDFGDMVRSACNSTAEDEVNLELVNFRMSIFEALVRGYLKGTQGMLNKTERLHLSTAACVITFENGMRFLTDYISGDKYFKIKRPNHNLDRARNQFALLQSMELNINGMNQYVTKFI